MAKARVFRKGGFRGAVAYPQASTTLYTAKRPRPNRGRGLSPIVGASLFLQLPLQNLNFFGKGHVVADQAFDLAHRV